MDWLEVIALFLFVVFAVDLVFGAITPIKEGCLFMRQHKVSMAYDLLILFYLSIFLILY